MLFITEADIQQVMRETGMEHIQARRHLECRRILQQRAQTAHAHRISSLIERAQADVHAVSSGSGTPTILYPATADPTSGALTSSVPHAVNPQN